MTPATPSLAVAGVHVRYGGVAALNGVDLDVARGEFVALLGPSGCGKTSLLRVVAGFVHPDQGAVRLNGRDVAGLPPRSRNIGIVFQSYALFPHMSVLDNVLFGLQSRKVPPAAAAARARDALDLVGLAAFAGRRPKQLSGGQQQRVALARAIVIEPDLLLLDEPLGALDKQLRVQMQTELKSLQRRLGVTAVFVTHDQEEAMSMADRIVVMRDGAIAQTDGAGGQLFGFAAIPPGCASSSAPATSCADRMRLRAAERRTADARWPLAIGDRCLPARTASRGWSNCPSTRLALASPVTRCERARRSPARRFLGSTVEVAGGLCTRRGAVRPYAARAEAAWRSRSAPRAHVSARPDGCRLIAGLMSASPRRVPQAGTAPQPGGTPD